ncbi:hypothetical protein [Aggregatibacter actinomycetemcomitans]|uniref:hypothetical protein n=1 Tax=Aggregatibacter actinomycetemcomitans TaxID=714 RepID=UPI0001B9F3C6|nr:hypothetical protein [Aggregatibacter actinomycetemcomitans]AHN71371.1 hypothetical protein CF65_00886 [Aggregatibacter actinomycetemcomitans HK1651]
MNNLLNFIEASARDSHFFIFAKMAFAMILGGGRYRHCFRRGVLFRRHGRHHHDFNRHSFKPVCA